MTLYEVLEKFGRYEHFIIEANVRYTKQIGIDKKVRVENFRNKSYNFLFVTFSDLEDAYKYNESEEDAKLIQLAEAQVENIDLITNSIVLKGEDLGMTLD